MRISVTIRRSLRLGLTLVVVGVWWAGPAAAGQLDEVMTRGKQLYAAAAYEEALAIFARRDDAEGLRYRALSLLALDRLEDARQAAEALVIAEPGVVVSPKNDPPRYVTTVNEAKRNVLPQILRAMVSEGSEQFQAKQYEKALEQFEQIAALLSDPAINDAEALKDLHVLSAGFLELAKANVRPPTTVPASAPPPEVRAPMQVTPPVALRQTLPPWPSTLPGAAAATPGAVTIVIGADGRVKDAAMTTRMHPVYDRVLLDAARGWLYKPALRNGVPVETLKIVHVQVSSGAPDER
jgi:tetratricopeptide (TPR) repeat protein